ncbi:MAG: hypothetical protein KAS39_05835, partial [Actinomycetia bacterium]|nr:hypothetical protein [Actinomycetes bacterium]
IIEEKGLRPVVLFTPEAKSIVNSTGLYISSLPEKPYYPDFQYFSDSSYLFRESKKKIKSYKKIDEHKYTLKLNIPGTNISVPEIILYKGENYYLEFNEKLIPLLDKKWSEWNTIKIRENNTDKHLLISFYLKKRKKNIEIYISPLVLDPFYERSISNDPLYLEEIKNKFGMINLTSRMGYLPEYYSNIPKTIITEFIQRDLRKKIEIFTDILKKEKFHLLWIDIEDLMTEVYLNTTAKNGLLSELEKLFGEINDYKVDNTVTFLYSSLSRKIFPSQINVNRFLINKGYMVLARKEEREKEKTSIVGFSGINWSRTKAYAVNNNIYVNLIGREKNGIIKEGKEYDKLIKNLRWVLKNWYDTTRECFVVENVYYGRDIYSGIFTSQRPDLILGLNKGYSISGKSAKGIIAPVFTTLYGNKNTGVYSTDMTIEKGSLFINLKAGENNDVKNVDIVPAILKILGIYRTDIDGKPIY